MNPLRMTKEEYSRFRWVINILTLIAFLLVFFFVELKGIKEKSALKSFVAIIILSAILLMIGMWTVLLKFSNYFGETMIMFGFLIFISVATQILYKRFSIFMITELLLGIVSFLYGKGLLSKGDSFLSLRLVTSNVKKR